VVGGGAAVGLGAAVGGGVAGGAQLAMTAPALAMAANLKNSRRLKFLLITILLCRETLIFGISVIAIQESRISALLSINLLPCVMWFSFHA
jgi:hypothetical protein